MASQEQFPEKHLGIKTFGPLPPRCRTDTGLPDSSEHLKTEVKFTGHMNACYNFSWLLGVWGLHPQEIPSLQEEFLRFSYVITGHLWSDG